MNKLIEKQLEKCKVANLNNYDELRHQFIIPKFVKEQLDIGNFYIIEVDESTINPKSNDTLSCNWNKGTHPINKYLKVIVNNKLGNMINVDSISYDINTGLDSNNVWSGWLSTDRLKIIKKL